MGTPAQQFCILTGASSGIGAAIAQRLSREGRALVLVGRSREKLTQVASELPSPTAIVAVDLTEPQAPEQIWQGFLNSSFRDAKLTALVNNAGIVHRLPFSEITDATIRLEFETNFFAPARLIRFLLPHFVNPSAIINVSSTLGIRPIAGTSAYSASKAALNNLTQSLAIELAPGTRVCAVCPGLIDTPIHSFHGEQETSRERISAHRAQPMGRMGRPEEVAGLVSFLMSADSAWTTGSLHVIDGGISLI
jgi:NAD(P)-dependent dehydrogenase (short-subunit alcohol dehydrogenase family)